MEEQIVAFSAVPIVQSLISWGGLIIILLIFKGFITFGISLALKDSILNSTGTTQERLIRFLVNKSMTMKALYEEVHAKVQNGEITFDDQ